MEEADPDPRHRARADLFSGSGIGLLLGTILGLAITPVVATVVGTLTSLLAIFLGLNERETPLRLPVVNALRIGAFGFATIAGLVFGLYLRVNNPLADDPSVAMARWNAAFPDNPALAQQMMVFERTALRPAQISFGEAGGEAQAVEADPALSGAKQAVLFSDLSEYDACNRLDPQRLGSPEETLAAYTRGDPPDLIRAVADRLGGVADEDKALAVTIAHDILCDVQELEAQ